MKVFWKSVGYLASIAAILSIGIISWLDWAFGCRLCLHYFFVIYFILIIFIRKFYYILFVKIPLLTILIINISILNLCIIHLKRSDYLEIFYGLLWILIVNILSKSFINDWKATFSPQEAYISDSGEKRNHEG